MPAKYLLIDLGLCLRYSRHFPILKHVVVKEDTGWILTRFLANGLCYQLPCVSG